MKLIIAIIQPHRLEAVKSALSAVDVFRLTIVDCQGFGRQQGKSEMDGVEDLSINLRRKVQLQIAVNDEFYRWTTAFAFGRANVVRTRFDCSSCDHQEIERSKREAAQSCFLCNLLFKMLACF